MQIVEWHRGGLRGKEKYELAVLQGSATLHAETVGIKGAAAAGAQMAEIAAALRIGRHGGTCRLSLAVAKSLVVTKEKCLVLADGAAEGCAELIAMQRLNGSRRKSSWHPSRCCGKIPRARRETDWFRSG